MTFPQMLSLDCIVRCDPEIIAAEAHKDLVMVSIANGLYYVVSDVAREIWQERTQRISDLVNDRQTTYQDETLSVLLY
jgi:hypothetical protein